MKMLCWAEYNDSHGFILRAVFWLPEGDLPERDSANYERIPHFDFERPENAQRLDLKHQAQDRRAAEFRSLCQKDV
jgi:hypothetical protein